jgi:hypothetical protein
MSSASNACPRCIGSQRLLREPRPYLEENSEFERDAIGHKCRLDFGVGVIDYRGLYKNAGK